ncbi:phospholipase D-like domain-containing protein [Nocardioides caldifontis]|uniref:phospholipase D-like domain-containing protein n=1 Tax=Nocardioides caldifontis TaxID=2588938 RepID=UPI0011DFB1F1|nr:phospholipase D-like domain-containing protein [Nocardioides caldifontis]
MTSHSVRSPLSSRKGWAVVATLVLALSLLPFAGGATRADAAPKDAPKSAPDSYTPRFGVKFNQPLGGKKQKKVIVRHLARTINSAPPRSTIRIVSWNIKSTQFVQALLKAHRRGVGVRVLMAKSMGERQRKSGAYWTLKRGLDTRNKKRPPALRSYMRGCKASCRGYGGIAHTKMYLFSHAGNAKNVVMIGSANFTAVAAISQWNDMFTVTNRPRLFQKAEAIFHEMAKDKKAAKPYQQFVAGKDLQAWWYPYRGKNAKGDPIVNVLKRVRCKGATGGAGRNGRTVIRVGQTGLLGDPGARIARKLQQLRKQGCNIRVLTAVSDRQVKPKLAGLAWRFYTQDTTGDGVYDRYIHMKVLTINGVWGAQRNARLTINGTANWSPKALNSDEAGFKVFRGDITRKYERWIDKLYNNPPRNASRTASTMRVENVRVTNDGRVLSRAVLPNGKVVNPYAKVQLH